VITKMRGKGNFGKYVVLVVDLVGSCYPGSLLFCKSADVHDRFKTTERTHWDRRQSPSPQSRALSQLFVHFRCSHLSA